MVSTVISWLSCRTFTREEARLPGPGIQVPVPSVRHKTFPIEPDYYLRRTAQQIHAKDVRVLCLIIAGPHLKLSPGLHEFYIQDSKLIGRFLLVLQSATTSPVTTLDRADSLEIHFVKRGRHIRQPIILPFLQEFRRVGMEKRSINWSTKWSRSAYTPEIAGTQAITGSCVIRSGFVRP